MVPQLAGSRCEQINVLSFISLRFSRISKRIFTSRSSVRVWRRNERLLHYREIPQDAQAAANDVFDRISYKDGTTPAFATPPIRFSDYGKRDMEQAGYIGADTDTVLAELGFSPEQIRKLRESSVIQ